MDTKEHLEDKNYTLSLNGHHGKPISHNEVESELNKALKPEPWYIKVGERIDRIGDKVGYQIQKVLWKVYDFSRGTFIQ